MCCIFCLHSCFATCHYFLICTEHKIVIVGLDNAGKTTILYQFLMNEVVTTSPTIGSNVEEVVWKNVHFIMWDLGGQQSLRAAWATYYTNTEVCYCHSTLFKPCNQYLLYKLFQAMRNYVLKLGASWRTKKFWESPQVS